MWSKNETAYWQAVRRRNRQWPYHYWPLTCSCYCCLSHQQDSDSVTVADHHNTLIPCHILNSLELWASLSVHLSLYRTNKSYRFPHRDLAWPGPSGIRERHPQSIHRQWIINPCCTFLSRLMTTKLLPRETRGKYLLLLVQFIKLVMIVIGGMSFSWLPCWFRLFGKRQRD